MDQSSEMINVFFHKGWVVPTLIIFVLTIASHYIVSKVYRYLTPKVEKSHLNWDAALLRALFLPFKSLIWIVSLSLIIQILGFHFEAVAFSSYFTPLRNFFLILILLWFALRFIKNMETDYVRGQKKRKKPYDKTTVRAVCQISRIAVIVLATLIYLQSRNINLSAVLAFGGAGGIVVGLAAKDLLSNFFGGLMIYLDRPFSVGDWIRSPDREIEGRVEHIGWRLTRIITFEKRPLYVPNSIFSTVSVENPSRMSHRRIKTTIGIRYDDALKVRNIVKDIEEMIRNHLEIDSSQEVIVRFDDFGPFSLNLLIYAFTKATEKALYLQVKQDIYLKAIDIIEKSGARCAFPTTTVHFPENMTSTSFRPNE